MTKPLIRVLLVEDDVVDRMACRRSLAQDPDYEFVLSEAASGREGLQLAHQQQPDCILLDYHLPDLDGLEFLAELTDELGNISIPVMMLTGADNAAIAVAAMKRGARDYLIKDVDRQYLELLPAVIQRVLGERRMRMEKKLAEEELLQHRDHLEEVVTKRTDELAKVNEELRRDIAKRKLIEVELTKAKNDAEQANLAKSDFLSSMTHELRSPLNVMLGFTQLLEAGSPPPTLAQMTMLKEIANAGWYLLELINKILDLATIESGKVTVEYEPMCMTEVMSECRTMIELQESERGIQLNFPSPDLHLYAKADRTRVKQILINLLSNAIKYNRDGGTVEVSCNTSASKCVRISIKDTGPGLPPEKLAQLFQQFNRLGQETGSVEGTGIGLVVSKQLVELMGGAIGVESTVGQGSVFWFELISEDAPQLPAAKNFRVDGINNE